MSAVTYETPYEISRKGFAALLEKLGPGGVIQFISQYEMGAGDYTRERRKLFGHLTLEEIHTGILHRRKRLKRQKSG